MIIENTTKNKIESPIRIFGIATLSRVDGPGKRVVVFFQGCNIGCTWCHSPHSWSKEAPLIYRSSDCILCRRCEAVCENHVHTFKDGIHTLERENCIRCGRCIEACPKSSVYKESGVLYLPTKTISVEKLLEEIAPYLESCQGITLSGGEALLQTEGVLSLLAQCRKRGIHTAVETSGLLPETIYLQALPFVDVWLLGIRVVIGKDRPTDIQRMLLSARVLTSNLEAQIIPRIPMIPNIMEETEVLKKIDYILREIGIFSIWLNPWNADYDLYYKACGIPLSYEEPTKVEVKRCSNRMKQYFKEHGYQIINE